MYEAFVDVDWYIGVISGALLQLRTEFSLNCQQTELVVSALLLGALIASLFGGQSLYLCPCVVCPSPLFGQK